MSTRITEQEAQEAGVKRELLQLWYDVMQSIWSASIDNYKQYAVGAFHPVNTDNNDIVVGKRFRIEADMVNGSYIEVSLIDTDIKSKVDQTILRMRYTGNMKIVNQCLLAVIAANS